MEVVDPAAGQLSFVLFSPPIGAATNAFDSPSIARTPVEIHRRKRLRLHYYSIELEIPKRDREIGM